MWVSYLGNGTERTPLSARRLYAASPPDAQPSVGCASDRAGEGVRGWDVEAALGCAVGTGKEEGHVLAVNGGGDEAEVVGKEGMGGRASEAVDGAVAVGLGGSGGVEAAEGTHSGSGNAAKGLANERDHLVAFGEAVGIQGGGEGKRR